LLRWLGAPTLAGRRPLVWAIAVDSLGGGLFVPFFVVFLIHVARVPAEQIGLAYGVAAVLALPAGPLAGRLVDAVGPRPVIVVANLVRAACFLGLLAIGDLVGLLIVSVISHYAGDAFWTANGVLIARVVRPDEHRRWFAFQSSLRNIGMGMGALATALILALVQRTDAYVAFVLANAASYVVAAALLWSWEGARTARCEPDRDTSEKARGWLRAALADRTFRSLALTNVVFVIGAMAPGLLWTYYAVDLMSGPAWLPGVVFGINMAIAAGLQLPVSRIAESASPVMSLYSGLAGWALSFGLLAAMAWGAPIDVAVGFLAMVLIYSFGEILVGATIGALTARVAPDHARGRYLGVYQLTWTVSTIVAPVTLMTLSGVGPALPWAVLALATAMAVVPLRNLRHIKAGAAE
jgi:MFS family permease